MRDPKRQFKTDADAVNKQRRTCGKVILSLVAVFTEHCFPCRKSACGENRSLEGLSWPGEKAEAVRWRMIYTPECISQKTYKNRPLKETRAVRKEKDIARKQRENFQFSEVKQSGHGILSDFSLIRARSKTYRVVAVIGFHPDPRRLKQCVLREKQTAVSETIRLHAHE